MKKIIVAVLILMIVIAVAVAMLTRNQSMQNDEFSTTAVSTSEVITQEKETSTESHSQAVYIPTEKEVLDKFNYYIEFADKWIYNYDDNLNELGYYTDDEGELWAYVNDNEYETAELLKAEIRKYFESGYPVEFIDKAKNINGRICYPTYYGCGKGAPSEFEDILVNKLSDGTFEINYHLMAWDSNEPRFYIYDQVLQYRPNTRGEWYFYESKSSDCTSWEIYFRKYLETKIGACNAFSVADIDKDSIPEVILYSSDPQQYETRMMGYDKKNSLLFIEGCIEFVEIEKSDYICKIDTNGNYIETVVYNSDGEVLWEGMVIENENKKTYYSDNQKTTMFEYMKLINEYCPKNERKSLKRYDLNQENLDKYLFGYSA